MAGEKAIPGDEELSVEPFSTDLPAPTVSADEATAVKGGVIDPEDLTALSLSTPKLSTPKLSTSLQQPQLGTAAWDGGLGTGIRTG